MQEAEREAPAPGEAPPAPAKMRTARHKRRRTQPTVAVQVTRRWYYFSVGLQQVITDFAHGGGLDPLLAVWTEAERQQALKELRGHQAQLARLQEGLQQAERGGNQGPLRLVRAGLPPTPRRGHDQGHL